MIFSKKKKFDIVIRISPFNQRLQDLIIVKFSFLSMDEVDKKKNFWYFFQANASRKKEFSWEKKRLNDNLNHVTLDIYNLKVFNVIINI